MGGLADIKAARIRAILDDLATQRGSLSLEHLRQESEDGVKAALRDYKGVGPKTIACVLMFCLRRPEFPVDTHVCKGTEFSCLLLHPHSPPPLDTVWQTMHIAPVHGMHAAQTSLLWIMSAR